MNLDQEFHSFGVSETLRRQAVLVHNHRTGMALDVLERKMEQAERSLDFSWHIRCMYPLSYSHHAHLKSKLRTLKLKTKALIEHDRILRGEA